MLIKVNDAVLQYKLRKNSGFGKLYRLHSTGQTFYMFQNRILSGKKYSLIILKSYILFVFDIIWVLFPEPDKVEKVWHIIGGIRDGSAY